MLHIRHLLIIGLLCLAAAATAGAQEQAQSDASSRQALLAALAGHPKMADAEAFLSAFDGGKETSRFIVVLADTAVEPLAKTMATAEGRAALKAQVARTQAAFLSSLSLAGEDRVTSRFDNLPMVAMELTPEQLAEILDSKLVESVQPQHTFHLNLRQGRPMMHAQTPASVYSGKGVSVAVIDTGLDHTNPYITDKIVYGYNYFSQNTDYMDQDGHGTACAGIVAGKTADVGDYIGGVAPEAKVFGFRVFVGDDTTDEAIIRAMDGCITHQYRDPGSPILIASMSLGGDRYTSVAACDKAYPGFKKAADRLNAAGISVFVASGNESFCDALSSPACQSNVISVGAVYDADLGFQEDCVEPESCLGASSFSCDSPYRYFSEMAYREAVIYYSNSASFLNLLAPSQDAYTLGTSAQGQVFDPYFNGTSAATPYAAGAAACLQQAAKARLGRYLTAAEVKSVMVGSGDPILDFKSGVTTPRVNLANAIDHILPYNGWWWNADEPGTGLGIEVQGDKLYLAWYVYDASGRPVWYVCLASKNAAGTAYTGNLLACTGWPLGTAYTGYTPSTVGTASLSFSAVNRGTFSWTLNGQSGSLAVEKFMEELWPGDSDPRDINGWWWDPAFEGMGFFIEAKGGTIYTAWYNYRADNSARWWGQGGGANPGGFPALSPSYTQPMMEFTGGQVPGGAWKSPASSTLSSCSLLFNADGTANLSMSGQTYSLERFRFSSY
jgi:hypothetical protein